MLIDKDTRTKFQSTQLINRLWEQLLHWRWWIFVLLSVIALAFEFLSYHFNLENNLEQIRIFQFVFPYVLIFPALGLIFLGLIETRSELSHAVRIYNLQHELRRALDSANDWDEIADRLLQFMSDQYTIAGLSLHVYNQFSEKYENVADKFFCKQAKLNVHWIPLNHGGRQVALLHLYLFPDIPYPAAQVRTFQKLAPDFATAIERVQLLRSYTDGEQAIRKNERDRIARQLHDTVSHDLAYLRLKLVRLSGSKDLNGLAPTLSELEQMNGVIDDALSQLRSLMNESSEESHDLPSTDLVSQVRDFAFLIGTRANFQISFQNKGELKALSAQMQRQVLYLVREILRNVEKHARAKNVTLTFTWIDDGLTISVTDDGQGFDINLKQNVDGHYGIKLIREIVNGLRGTVSMVSDQNTGTQVDMWLPILEDNSRGM